MFLNSKGGLLSNWNFAKETIENGDLLIDCRTLTSFEEETIQGAIYLPSIKKAFGSDPDSNRKMLGSIFALIEKANQLGSTRIIAFDEGMGMFSARTVFLLRACGFKDAYILKQKWPFDTNLSKGPGKEKFEIITEEKVKLPVGIVDKAYLEKNLTKLQIFDTRTREEYEGKLPRLQSPEEGTLCGRLPGAFLWDWMHLYDQEGGIIDKDTFKKRLGGFPFMPERTTVIYDYNGARSCLLALMLKEIGYQDISTYQGSWYEWRKSSLPKQAVSIFGAKLSQAAPPRVGGLDKKK
jgi:thiosulfate/3-mercaptopyruvate sulfurtransferase